MTSLLSDSFRSPDMESGTEMVDLNTEKNLARFFEEVGVIKSEMEGVRQILLKMQEENEESKTVTNAQAMKSLRERMEKDVQMVLRKAKFIKAKLYALDRANEENRRVPGCEPGSSNDRARSTITNSLRKTLKDVMGEFQDLRQRMMSEYKETVQRRYYTLTGKDPDEETIERMIDSGESETMLRKAMQEQGAGQIVEAIREIQERHDAVKQIEKNLLELYQVFLDMAVLVEAQGDQLDNIEEAAGAALSFVKRGNDQLEIAKRRQRNSRKCKCLAIILLLIIVLVIVVPIVTTRL